MKKFKMMDYFVSTNRFDTIEIYWNERYIEMKQYFRILNLINFPIKK